MENIYDCLLNEALYLHVIFSTARWRRIINATTRKIKYDDFKPLILFQFRMQLAWTKTVLYINVIRAYIILLCS